MLFLASWAVLMGPLVYAQHLISGPRLPFTAAYFGSITMTLVFAIKVSLSFDLACLQARTQIPAHAPSYIFAGCASRNSSADQSAT